MLDGLTGFARDAVIVAGYPGIFAAMVLENVFPPIPSEIVLPLAGYEVARGGLDFAPTVAAATLGSLVGALILYAVGRFGGRPAVLRFGRILRVGARDLDRSEVWFDRWGDRVVLVARVVPLARSVVSIPAGMLRMPILRFSLLTAVGSLVWNLLLVGAGYQLEARWEDVSRLVGRSSAVVLGLVALAVVAGAVWLIRRWRAARSSETV